ncbi:hypothetical protein AA0118_g4365 [Alternaria tenuissima]|nr:hypothetical protein AA0118_g4365 [Alternaria tenuissima]
MTFDVLTLVEIYRFMEDKEFGNEVLRVGNGMTQRCRPKEVPRAPPTGLPSEIKVTKYAYRCPPYFIYPIAVKAFPIAVKAFPIAVKSSEKIVDHMDTANFDGPIEQSWDYHT